MALYHFHRVLIASTILFFFGFALYAFRRFGLDGGTNELVMGIGALVISTAAMAYLIYFNYALRTRVLPSQAGQQ